MKIGKIRECVLRLITKLQASAIRSDDTRIYYFLSKLHFMLYFRKNLIAESLIDSYVFTKAQKRHAKMVINILHNDKSKETKGKLYKLAKISFSENLLLEVKL